MADEANSKLRLIKRPPKQMELDFVTDDDFREVVAWQDIQWKANLEAARKIIDGGAIIDHEATRERRFVAVQK